VLFLAAAFFAAAEEPVLLRDVGAVEARRDVGAFFELREGVALRSGLKGGCSGSGTAYAGRSAARPHGLRM
jgi:hypothetical protein